ncbi:hypothetical protein [Micromonospora sp. NPDC048839]|uniref:hypothetical protein n=1 Tax=Micromonospora sp. NPDC048839 TaxID=3155641 RepID=UPI0033E19C88
MTAPVSKAWAQWHTPVTKWDLLPENVREALDAQPLGINCSGCSEPLPTEGAFARHFVLYDRQYLNLGYCPVKGRNPNAMP